MDRGKRTIKRKKKWKYLVKETEERSESYHIRIAALFPTLVKGQKTSQTRQDMRET